MDEPSAALLAEVTVGWLSQSPLLPPSRLFSSHLPEHRLPRRRRPPTTTSRQEPSPAGKLQGDSLVALQQLSVWQREPGEDGRRPKGRARLALAIVAVTDVQRQRFGSRRLEADGSALAAGVHGRCRYVCCFISTNCRAATKPFNGKRKAANEVQKGHSCLTFTLT